MAEIPSSDLGLIEKNKEVKDVETDNGNENNVWRPYLKQLLMCGSVWTCIFMSGMCLGAPTVIVPQLRKAANSTEAVSEEMASWLSTAYGIGEFPWDFLTPISARLLGRKITLILILLDALGGFITFYFSSTVIQLLTCLIVLGPLYSSAVSLFMLIMTEYTSPKHRGVFLTGGCATYAWGIWVSNAIGTFFHWRYISLLGIFLSSVTLILVFFCPESPYWLAERGRLDDCTSSFRWLRGTDKEAEKELEELLKSSETNTAYKQRNRLSKANLLDSLVACKTKEFYKPVLIGFLTFVLYSYTGKIVCMVYAIDIIQKITHSESTAYIGMLVLDGITVSGMYIGCVLSKYVKRRTLLFSCSSVGIVMLYVLSLYLYLIELSVIEENVYASIALLLIYSLAISSGPMILAVSVRGEIMPMVNRTLALILTTAAGGVGMSVAIKISPDLFSTFGLHGTFLFFGIITTVCVSLLYKYLPETKDKTLQEIAAFIRGDTARDVQLEKIL